MKQPEALRLAHWLERDGAQCQQHVDAGTELRRLHEVNQELLEALKHLLEDTQHAEHEDCEDGPCPVREARAVISKATEGKS